MQEPEREPERATSRAFSIAPLEVRVMRSRADALAVVVPTDEVCRRRVTVEIGGGQTRLAIAVWNAWYEAPQA